MLFPALLLAASCGGPQESEPPDRLDLGDRVGWEVAVRTAQVPVTTLPADVLAAPGASWRLAPPTAGRLTAWSVQPGQSVRAGDALASLTSPMLADLEAALASARATLTRRRAAAAAAAAAADRGVGSSTARRDAEAALAEAEAQVRGLVGRLGATKDTTSRSGASWLWTAPEAGVVQSLTCELGPVDPSTVCVHLVDPSSVQVRVRLPERLLQTVGERTTGTLTRADGRTSELVLLHAAPALDPHTRTQELRFAAQPAPPPGSSGSALLWVPSSDDMVRLPRAALTRVDGAASVLVRSGEIGIPTPVEQVGQDAEHIWVRGLPESTEVAVKGVFLLKSLALLDQDGGHEH